MKKVTTTSSFRRRLVFLKNRLWNRLHSSTTNTATSNTRRRRFSIASGTSLVVLVVLVGHRAASIIMARKQWKAAPIAHIERTCPAPNYRTLQDELEKQEDFDQFRTTTICLTTLTDEGNGRRWMDYLFAWRNYDGIRDLTWPNKQQYADKHGYHFYDQSKILAKDTSRQSSWSKVPAVQQLLQTTNCSWIVWMDADTVIMNSAKRLESILPRSNSPIDLLLTEDDAAQGGYNAGVWAVRNTDWTREFLQRWYDTEYYVLPTGTSNHGDQDALNTRLERTRDFSTKVAVPPRCTFNSFGKFVEPHEYEETVQNLQQQEWHLSEAYYHKGDWLAHVAGVDNKLDTLKLMLALAE